MKRLLLLSILGISLLVGFVYAELDLSDYPSPFVVGNTFNGILVIGDTAPAESVISASDISSSLQFKIGDDGTIVRINVGITLASEVSDYKAQNIISVGSPCENPVTAKVMGNPADCHQGFVLSEGIIQLFDTGNGNIALMVAGYNPADTRNAAAVLANYADYKSSLKGAKVIVKKVNNQLTVTEASSSSASGGGGGGGGTGTTNQCSYPEKVDCNTKEEADLVLNEWTQGKCSKEASLECINIWTKANHNVLRN